MNTVPKQTTENDNKLTNQTYNNPEVGRNQGKNKKIRASYRSLCAAVQKNDLDVINQILIKKPQFLSNPKTNQNIIKFACMKDKKQAVSFLSSLASKDIISKQQNYISEAIIECIRFQRFQMIKIIVNKGFDLDKIVFTKKQLALTCLDFAILGGHYQIAHYIFGRLNLQNKKIKNVADYESIGKKYSYRYVNYQMVTNGLMNNVEPKQIGNYLKKQLTAKRKEQIRSIYDEGCWGWLLRVLGCCQNKDINIQQLPTKKNTVNIGSTANIKQTQPITERQLKELNLK